MMGKYEDFVKNFKLVLEYYTVLFDNVNEICTLDYSSLKSNDAQLPRSMKFSVEDVDRQVEPYGIAAITIAAKQIRKLISAYEKFKIQQEQYKAERGSRFMQVVYWDGQGPYREGSKKLRHFRHNELIRYDRKTYHEIIQGFMNDGWNVMLLQEVVEAHSSNTIYPIYVDEGKFRQR